MDDEELLEPIDDDSTLNPDSGSGSETGNNGIIEDIDEYLKIIKNNIYGEQIRMAIHDALSSLYRSIEEGSKDSSEIIILEANRKLDNMYQLGCVKFYVLQEGNTYVGAPGQFQMLESDALLVSASYGEFVTQIIVPLGPNYATLSNYEALAKFKWIRNKTEANGWSTWIEAGITNDPQDTSLVIPSDTFDTRSMFKVGTIRFYYLKEGTSWGYMPDGYDSTKPYLLVSIANGSMKRQDLVPMTDFVYSIPTWTRFAYGSSWTAWYHSSSGGGDADSDAVNELIQAWITANKAGTTKNPFDPTAMSNAINNWVTNHPNAYGQPTAEEIEDAVNAYLEEHPVEGGISESRIREIIQAWITANKAGTTNNPFDSTSLTTAIKSWINSNKAGTTNNPFDSASLAAAIKSWINNNKAGTTNNPFDSTALNNSIASYLTQNPVGVDETAVKTIMEQWVKNNRDKIIEAVGFATPQMYGNTGDAIKTAIDNNQGGTVYVPAGEYRITSPITTGNKENTFTDLILDPSAVIIANQYMRYMLEIGGANTESGSQTEEYGAQKKIVKGGVWNSNNHVSHAVIIIHSILKNQLISSGSSATITMNTKNVDISDCRIIATRCNDDNVLNSGTPVHNICVGLCVGECLGSGTSGVVANAYNTLKSLDAYIHHLVIENGDKPTNDKTSAENQSTGLLLNALDNDIDNVRVYYFTDMVTIYGSNIISNIHTLGVAMDVYAGIMRSFYIKNASTVKFDKCYGDTTDTFISIDAAALGTNLDIQQCHFYQYANAYRPMKFISADYTGATSDSTNMIKSSKIRINGLYYDPKQQASNQYSNNKSRYYGDYQDGIYINSAAENSAHGGSVLAAVTSPLNLYMENIVIGNSQYIKNGDVLKGAAFVRNGYSGFRKTTLEQSGTSANSYWYKVGTFQSKRYFAEDPGFRLTFIFNERYLTLPWMNFGVLNSSLPDNPADVNFRYSLGGKNIDTDDTVTYEIGFAVDRLSYATTHVPVSIWIRMINATYTSGGVTKFNGRYLTALKFESPMCTYPSTDTLQYYKLSSKGDTNGAYCDPSNPYDPYLGVSSLLTPLYPTADTAAADAFKKFRVNCNTKILYGVNASGTATAITT